MMKNITKIKGNKIPPKMQEEISLAIKKCYACSRCTSGCPVASEMDFPPSVIMRWLLLGEYDKIIKANTIWVCSTCQTCYSRCPFEIDIPHIMDMLKEYADKNNLSKKERAIRTLHHVFLGNVKLFGRIHEAGFIGVWKAVSGKWFNDLSLGAKMFLKGKLLLLPEKIKGQKEVKRFFKDSKKNKL